MKRLWAVAPLLVAAVAFAHDDDHERARRLRLAGEILPLSEVVAKAGAYQPGRVLEVELEQKDERWLYELEVLDERGQLWKVLLDARTGELIQRKEH